MEKHHRDILRRNLPDLMQKINNVADVVIQLQSTTPIVLTDDMAEEILVERTQRDKLRKLLSTVTFRGPNAFDEVYKALCKTHNGHAADLLCPERAQQRKDEDITRLPPPPSHPVNTGATKITSRTEPRPHLQASQDVVDINIADEWPTDGDIEAYYKKKAITLPDVFDKVKQNSRPMDIYKSNTEVYPLSSDDKGMGIIILNESKNSKNYEKQNFDVDISSVQECFRLLGYSSEKPLKDYKKEDLEQKLNGIIKKVKTTSKSIVVFVIAYGNSDGFFCNDDKLMTFSELKKIVSTCKDLEDKPKLFFIQTLRKVISDSDKSEKISSDSSKDAKKTKESDNFLFHSWITDNFHDNTDFHGCFFVHAFVHTAIHSCLTDDIYSIIRKVKLYVDKVQEDCNSSNNDNKIQCGCTEDNSLTKKFYFFPYEVNDSSSTNMFETQSVDNVQ